MAGIFDQYQPKSHLAKSLNEAFAGCDTWQIAPPRRRPDGTLPQAPAGAFSSPALEAPAWIQPPR